MILRVFFHDANFLSKQRGGTAVAWPLKLRKHWRVRWPTKECYLPRDVSRLVSEHSVTVALTWPKGTYT